MDVHACIGTCLAIRLDVADPHGVPTNASKEWTMPAVTMPAHKKGDYLVDYEEKVFEDVKAEPGEKALVTFLTVAFEGSISIVNILHELRLQRKGFKTTVMYYYPAFTT